MSTWSRAIPKRSHSSPDSSGSLTTLTDNKQTLDELRVQADVNQVLDSTNVSVIASQDTIIGLLHANRETLQMAFDTASVLYKARSDELIQEIRKPKFGMGLGSGLAGGMLVGILAGLAAGN